MSKNKQQQTAGDAVESAPIQTPNRFPFKLEGFAQPSASDAKGYESDDKKRTVKTLANVVMGIDGTNFRIVGGAVKATITAGAKPTISVVLPTMKRGSQQTIQTEDAAEKKALADFKLHITKQFSVWWAGARESVAASASSTNGITADELGIEL